MIRTMPKIRLPHAHAARILRLIFERNQISRAELAAETGFSAFLISKLCERLLDAGYISEVAAHLGTGLVALINLLNPELVVVGGIDVRGRGLDPAAGRDCCS